MSNYHHLSSEERAYILLGLNNGSSIRAMSRGLNRSASTISRELSRNQCGGNTYDATRAATRYRHCRLNSVRPFKLYRYPQLGQYVHNGLVDKQGSPKQISGTLKRINPTNPTMQVSHDTIYRHIYATPRGSLKKLMLQSLRLGKKKKGFRGNPKRFSRLKIEENQLIAHRPDEINNRCIPGHWEGDLMMGAMNRSCVGTLVDRKTGYLVLSKMDSKSAMDVRTGFERQMRKLPAFLRLSMTYDRGSEMAEHPIMSKNLSIDIYFADPHAPWQRGSSENINGLIRQYLPKGENLSQYTQQDLDQIAWLLNTRPRERFDFYSPQELIEDILRDHLQTVALDS